MTGVDDKVASIFEGYGFQQYFSINSRNIIYALHFSLIQLFQNWIQFHRVCSTVPGE